MTFISLQINAQTNLHFVTYGPEAEIAEGDNDFKQVFFIKIEESYNELIAIELFDPEWGSELDHQFGPYNSEFIFSLYGGSDIITPATIQTDNPSPRDLHSGRLLSKWVTGDTIITAEEWVNLKNITTNEGENVGGFSYLKLVVEGKAGDDANVYNVRATTKNPEAVKIFNYAPTVRLPEYSEPLYLIFKSDRSDVLLLNNFDVDNALLELVTPYRNIPILKRSGDGVWAESQFELFPFEKEEKLAVKFGPGKSKVNDAVFYIKDAHNNYLPFELPIETQTKNLKPVVSKSIEQGINCSSVVLDASQSYDNDGDELSFRWYFADGTFRSGSKIEQSFSTVGKHKVTLAVKDNSSAVEKGRYQNFEVNINAAPRAVAGADQISYPGAPILLDASRSSDVDGYIQRYEWDLADGNFSKKKKFSYRFNEPGLYNVALKVYDNSNYDCNFGLDTITVWINHPPIADAGNDIACSVGETMKFIGENSFDEDGSIKSYFWNFGNGQTALKKNVEHAYLRPGKYKVTLKVTDNSGVRNDTGLDIIYVSVNHPPVARAGSDKIVAVGESVSFDASKSSDKDGEIIAYSWTIDKEIKFTGKKISYSFDKPGRYQTTLKVKDNSGTKTDFDEDVIWITVNDRPLAELGGDIYQTVPDILFDASMSKDNDGIITEYNWDFGDGSYGEGKLLNHFYTRAGEYKVKLKIKDDSPASNNYDETEINVVINSKPIADAGPDLVVAPGEKFLLSGLNSVDRDGKIQSYEWKILDKVISTNPEFQHSIAEEGKYNILLSVKDDSEHKEAIDFDNLTVKVNSQPDANAGDDIYVAPGQKFILDGGTSLDYDGQLTSYRWNISNGKEYNGTRHEIVITDIGVYTAELIVEDNDKLINSIDRDEVKIYVNSSPVIKTKNYLKTCSQNVLLSASDSYDSDGDILKYEWQFDDGSVKLGPNVNKTFSDRGKHPVVLIVSDNKSLSNSISKSMIEVDINSAPVAVAGNDILSCTGDLVNLNASESYDFDGDLLRYLWDLGDGTKAEGISVVKNYGKPGIYEVVLTVSDNSGMTCNNSIDKLIITVVESPVADAGLDMEGCMGSIISFDAGKSTDSDGIVNSYEWDFGDGEKGGGVVTTHKYQKAGVYKVGLTITGESVGECDDSDYDELIVTINDAPIANFTYQDSIALGDEIIFDASSSKSAGSKIISYNWDFGDEGKGNNKSVSHRYKNYGIYKTKLKIETDSKSDCTSSEVVKSIYVNSRPIPKTSERKNANVYETVILDGSASSDLDGAITKYFWNFGDGTTAEGVTVTKVYSKPGLYKAELKVFDNTGLSNNNAVSEILITINGFPTANISAPEYSFVGSEVQIKADNFNDDGTIIYKNISANNISDSLNTKLNTSFEKPGVHEVKLELKDDKGLTNIIGAEINIYSIPVIEIAGKEVVCRDKNEIFKSQIYFPNKDLSFDYSWMLDDKEISSEKNLVTKFSNIGENHIKLQLSHQGKKLSEVGKVVFVNSPPKADFIVEKVNYINGANDAVKFDASNSADPDVDPLTYTWDFGDGKMATGVVVHHEYSKPGNYMVILSVSDSRNCECSKSSVSQLVDITKRK